METKVYVRTRHFQEMKDYFANGIHVTRRKGHKHGKGNEGIQVEACYKVPKKGYLFKARAGASQKYLHYHAIYTHVRREAPKFLQDLKKAGIAAPAEVAKLRPHSGRAFLITELMGDGLSTALSMKYARHAPGSIRVHLRYGRLSLRDVKGACDALCDRGDQQKRSWLAMSTAQLLRYQKEITTELTRRHKS